MPCRRTAHRLFWSVGIILSDHIRKMFLKGLFDFFTSFLKQGSKKFPESFLPPFVRTAVTGVKV